MAKCFGLQTSASHVFRASVGSSSLSLDRRVSEVTYERGRSVRSTSSLRGRPLSVEHLANVRADFNGSLLAGLVSLRTRVRGFGRGACNVDVSSSLCDREGSGESPRSFLEHGGYQQLVCLTALRKIIIPAAALLIGLFLRTNPGLAVGGTGLQNAGVGLARKQLLVSAWTGLAAGCLHTLTGPDHLAALAPLCIGRTKLESAAVGALWGFGHDTGQVLFGVVFLLLKDKLHLDMIRTWAARVVGLTLVAIGGIGIVESHELSVALVGGGGGGEQNITQDETRVKPRRNIATFATGVVHGLQPDALLMVLPALALPSRVQGVAYLGMFLVGTVIAMGSYTFSLPLAARPYKRRFRG